MHDARARLAGWMNACDRPASQRARLASRQRAAGRMADGQCARSRIPDRPQARAHAMGTYLSGILDQNLIFDFWGTHYIQA